MQDMNEMGIIPSSFHTWRAKAGWESSSCLDKALSERF